MAQKKKYISFNPDPLRFDLVRTRDGDYLRLRRNTLKKSGINESFKENAADTGSPQAKEIMKKLAPFTKNCYGRKQVYLSALLRKAKKVGGKMDYSFLMRWELMKDYPLFNIYIGQYKVSKKKGTINIEVPLGEDIIYKKTPGATHYYFEAILIHGDANIPGDLRSEYDRSSKYSYEKNYEGSYTLSVIVPEKRPYIVFFKVGCKDGKIDSNHPKNYGVKVVDVGGARLKRDAMTLKVD